MRAVDLFFGRPTASRIHMDQVPHGSFSSPLAFDRNFLFRWIGKSLEHAETHFLFWQCGLKYSRGLYKPLHWPLHTPKRHHQSLTHLNQSHDFPKPPQKTLDGSNQCVLWHMVALLIQGLVKPCSTVISQDSTTAMASTKDFEVTFSITPL